MMAKIQRVRRWTWARRITAVAFLLVLFLGRFEWFPWIKGSTSATRLFGILWLADPMAALEVTVATRQFYAPLLLAGGLLLLFYALLGRVFCGWVCPLGLLLDLNDEWRGRLLRWLSRRGVNLPEIMLSRRVKYWLLALSFILSIVVGLPVFQLVSPINVLTRSLVFAPATGLLLIGGILILELLSRRAWCKALCPLGAFYSLVGRSGFWRVRIDYSRTFAERPCRLCDRRCPMGIELVEEHILSGKPTIDDMECTRCGTCVEVCPRGSLRMGIEIPSPLSLRKHVPAGVHNRYDPS